MIEEENKVLGPHQGLVQVINLGSQRIKRGKNCTSLPSEIRKKIINLLCEYSNIFA